MTSAESRAVEFAPLRGFDAEEAEIDFYGAEVREQENGASSREPSIQRAL